MRYKNEKKQNTILKIKEYYNSLSTVPPNKNFKDKVCAGLGISSNTFYRIIDGTRKLKKCEEEWIKNNTDILKH